LHAPQVTAGDRDRSLAPRYAQKAYDAFQDLSGAVYNRVDSILNAVLELFAGIFELLGRLLRRRLGLLGRRRIIAVRFLAIRPEIGLLLLPVELHRRVIPRILL